MPTAATICRSVDFDRRESKNYRKHGCGAAKLGEFGHECEAELCKRLPFGGLFASIVRTKRGLTVSPLAGYAGGFVEQYNLLWRKEFRFDQSCGALFGQCGSGDVISPRSGFQPDSVTTGGDAGRIGANRVRLIT
jgi:hypothetical protein